MTTHTESLEKLLDMLQDVCAEHEIISVDYFPSIKSVRLQVRPDNFLRLFPDSKAWREEEFRPTVNSIRRDASLAGWDFFAYFPCDVSYKVKE